MPHENDSGNLAGGCFLVLAVVALIFLAGLIIVLHNQDAHNSRQTHRTGVQHVQ